MLPYMQFPLTCLCLLFRLHTALSLPSTPLANPPLSLIQNPVASNLSKPTYPTPHTQLQAHTEHSPTSSDTFPIPNTDLILRFSVFGTILETSELNDLLTQAQEDVQVLISRHGTDVIAADDTYRPWRSENIALEVYRVTTDRRLTLGQLRSMIEGLGLYMIQRGFVHFEPILTYLGPRPEQGLVRERKGLFTHETRLFTYRIFRFGEAMLTRNST